MRRRELLRSSAAVGLGVAIAGCSDATNAVGGNDGSDGDGRSVDVEQLQSWLFAPGTVSDRDHYQYYFLAPSSIDDAQEALSEETFNLLHAPETSGVNGFQGGFKDLTNVDFWEVDGYLVLPSAEVLLGEFDRAEVERRLGYNDLEYEGDYQGYTLYGGEGPTVGLEGVEGEDGPPETTSAIVIGEPTSTGEDASGLDGGDVARGVIDAKGGSADSYVEDVDAMATLTDALGTGDLATGRTHEPVGETAAADLNTDAEPITYGQTVQGELSNDDSVEINGNEYQFFDKYGFAGSEGELVTVTMSTESETSFIALVGPEDDVISTTYAERDGTAEGVQLPPQELPIDGTYEVHVSTQELLDDQSRTLDEPIDYTLTLEVDPSTTDGPASGVFEGEVGRGTVAEFGEDATTDRTVLVFEESVPESDVQTWIDENEDAGVFTDYDEVSLEVAEGVATVEATIETDEYVPRF